MAEKLPKEPDFASWFDAPVPYSIDFSDEEASVETEPLPSSPQRADSVNSLHEAKYLTSIESLCRAVELEIPGIAQTCDPAEETLKTFAELKHLYDQRRIINRGP